MAYFKAKMHQIRFRLELRLRSRWRGGELTGAFSDPSWISWAYTAKKKERRTEDIGEGRGGKEEMIYHLFFRFFFGFVITI